MISPTENEKFAIPLIAPEISCDAIGNFVPNVLRDSFDRIRNASGLIHGGKLPKGSPPSQMMKEMKGNFKTKYEIVQIIPAVWGGSGCHPDNLNFPSYKQVLFLVLFNIFNSFFRSKQNQQPRRNWI